MIAAELASPKSSLAGAEALEAHLPPRRPRQRPAARRRGELPEGEEFHAARDCAAIRPCASRAVSVHSRLSPRAKTSALHALPPPLALLLSLASLGATAPASTVTVERSPEGKFTLLRDGKPYFIKGAGGQSHLDTLVACGGNTIRTWGIDALEEKVDGKPLLDRAQELGLTVTVGLWVQHERHGFDYGDEHKVAEQREAIRQAVHKYKDHPAVLMWGLGNEMEGPASDGRNARIWQELNTLAAIVKKEDPNHPVMTAIASAAESKVKGVVAYYPNLDILGINAYAGASGTGPAIKHAGWNKAFILTEFGTPGHWEVPKTAWGAPIEPSSWEKAASYYATQKGLLEAAPDTCLGSFAFRLGTQAGSHLELVRHVSRDRRKAPERRWHLARLDRPLARQPQPQDRQLHSSPPRTTSSAAGKETTAAVEATDAENDPLTYEWAVFAESTDVKVGGDKEAAPPSFPSASSASPAPPRKSRRPAKPGAYRLFVTVRDGHGGASRDNIPFLVTPEAR